ncbi:MAG: hypothetical protein LBM38_05460 [Clostridiales bacterium]|jgi:hypothetical protein|nr:hypothetical protein [Clostridiales bacterium]
MYEIERILFNNLLIAEKIYNITNENKIEFINDFPEENYNIAREVFDDEKSLRTKIENLLHLEDYEIDTNNTIRIQQTLANAIINHDYIDPVESLLTTHFTPDANNPNTDFSKSATNKTKFADEVQNYLEDKQFISENLFNLLNKITQNNASGFARDESLLSVFESVCDNLNDGESKISEAILTNTSEVLSKFLYISSFMSLNDEQQSIILDTVAASNKLSHKIFHTNCVTEDYMNSRTNMYNTKTFSMETCNGILNSLDTMAINSAKNFLKYFDLIKDRNKVKVEEVLRKINYCDDANLYNDEILLATARYAGTRVKRFEALIKILQLKNRDKLIGEGNAKILDKTSNHFKVPIFDVLEERLEYLDAVRYDGDDIKDAVIKIAIKNCGNGDKLVGYLRNSQLETPSEKTFAADTIRELLKKDEVSIDNKFVAAKILATLKAVDYFDDVYEAFKQYIEKGISDDEINRIFRDYGQKEAKIYFSRESDEAINLKKTSLPFKKGKYFISKYAILKLYEEMHKIEKEASVAASKKAKGGVTALKNAKQTTPQNKANTSVNPNARQNRNITF